MNPKTIKNLIAAILWVFNTPMALSYYRSFEDGIVLGLILGGLIFAVLQLISDQPFYNGWSDIILGLGVMYAILLPISYFIFG